MLRFLKILLGFVAVLVVIGGALRLAYPAYSWQQTLTFYITTPDGPVVATNTGRATYTSGVQIFIDGGGGGWSYDGEALVADLGDGKYLFSLLDNNLSLARWIGDRNGYFNRDDNYDEKVRKIRRSRGEVWDVPFDLLPPLVTFGDINDMETLVFLEPTDIGAVLSDGYGLDRVTFGLTREPTTVGQIDELRRAWFVGPSRGFYDFALDGQDQVKRINSSDFWQGDASRRFIERK